MRMPEFSKAEKRMIGQLKQVFISALIITETESAENFYEKLEEILTKQGVTNVNACIAYTEHEDKHLHNDSVCFHKKLGYKTVGIFHKCAYKFDKWYDMIWMEKFIAGHSANPNDIIPYPMLNC